MKTAQYQFEKQTFTENRFGCYNHKHENCCGCSSKMFTYSEIQIALDGEVIESLPVDEAVEKYGYKCGD